MTTFPIYPHLITALDRYYGLPAEPPTVVSKTPHRRSSRSSRELRILLSTFWKYPTTGGLTTYLKALKTGLEKRGHRVDIVHPESFDADDQHEIRARLKTAIERFLENRYKRVNPNIVSHLQLMLSYEVLLSRKALGKYDIFHAHDRFTANVLGRLNQPYCKPLFFTPHGPMTHERLKQGLIEQGSDEEAFFWQIDRKAVEVADKCITLSEIFRPLLINLGAEDSKLEMVHTGIEFRSDARKSDEGRLVISCIARLGPRKGHKILLEALHSIRQHLDSVRVYIVGDGEMRSELEALSSKLDLRNVLFLGERDDVPDILGKSDIYVLPTTSDALPISVIEAMLAGKAIVTTRCGGIPEIIRHQETGLLAEPGDAKQLADRLLQLIQDRRLIRQLGNNAKQYARDHLTADKMSVKIERVYRSVS